MNESQEFKKLMSACDEISSYFPDGVVFIGGVAVYMHCRNNEKTENFAETTHDGDLYISLNDFTDLRSIEELTNNRRLSKHQMVKKGIEFDIYVERQSNLKIPYSEIVTQSYVYDSLRVASLAHVLILKLEAYKERKGSVKGEKDARDLIRILLVAAERQDLWEPNIVQTYLDEDDQELLQALPKNSAVLALAEGNAQNAKQIRTTITDILGTVVKLPKKRMSPK